MSRPLVCDGCGLPISPDAFRLRLSGYTPDPHRNMFDIVNPEHAYDFCSFGCAASLAMGHAVVQP